MKRNIIGIKFGSATLVDAQGRLKRQIICAIAEQVKLLVTQGQHVFIVTSGAIASAPDVFGSKNLRAAVGQVRLMGMYQEEFARVGLVVAQGLPTDRELVDCKSPLMRDLIHESFAHHVVFLINANDVVDNEEIKALEQCADNDKLFTLVCERVGVDIAVIVFNETSFRGHEGKALHCIDCKNLDHYLSFAKGSSVLGHGSDGMATKVKSLARLCKMGVRCHLVSVHERDFIARAVAGEEHFGTRFVA